MPVTKHMGRPWAWTHELDRWLQEASPDIPFWNRVAFLHWYAAGITIVALALAGFCLWEQLRNGTSEAASYTIDHGLLIVNDHTGKPLFFYKLDPPGRQPDFPDESTFLVADIDGDGVGEVIVNPLRKNRSTHGDDILVFNAKGDLLWSHQLRTKVEHHDQQYGPVYHARYLITIPDLRIPGRHHLVVSFVHALGQPSQLAVLDSEGKLVREFWHLGHLMEPVYGNLDGRGSKLFVGAHCQASGGGEILVFEPENLPMAKTLDASGVIVFSDLPQSGVSTLIRFAPTVFAKRLLSTPVVASLGVQPGYLQAHVMERPAGSFPYLNYELNGDLQIMGLRPGGAFKSEYEQYRATRFPDLPPLEQETERLKRELQVIRSPHSAHLQ